jgi:hypothetical protein
MGGHEFGPRFGSRCYRSDQAALPICPTGGDEIFVLHDGQTRYEVEGTNLDAHAADMVIVPPDAWHTFVNTGPGMLRHPQEPPRGHRLRGRTSAVIKAPDLLGYGSHAGINHPTSPPITRPVAGKAELAESALQASSYG